MGCQLVILSAEIVCSLIHQSISCDSSTITFDECNLGPEPEGIFSAYERFISRRNHWLCVRVHECITQLHETTPLTNIKNQKHIVC